MDELEIVVREFDQERDREGADSVDRSCEAGPSGKMTLYTDLLGDPICRVRHSPAFLVLVAETTAGIVGLIRGCIKTVTCGKKILHGGDGTMAVYTKVGYILGLRVSPSYRRKKIALNLVCRMEEWFQGQGAEYAYMATDSENDASVSLFTGRCGYSPFRTPAILVQPVFAHPLSSHTIQIRRLSPAAAEILYRRKFSTVDFFPKDIDAVLNNPLSVATLLALPPDYSGDLLADPPASWAVASVWDCRAVFRMEVRGASRIRRGLAAVSRAADRAMPWLRIPSVPDLFRPFGMYLMYGVGGEGAEAAAMLKAVCRRAHDMAREPGCRVVAAEVAGGDPMRKGIPHWRRLSCAEDLWCVKRLAEGYGDGGAVGDWTKSPEGDSIFVDPREF